MKKTIKIKKTLALMLTLGFGIFGLTACGADPSLPAVKGGFGETPKISAGSKGKEPKDLKKAVLVEGKGEACGADAVLKTNYTGQLWDGKVFDSSFERGEKNKDTKGKTVGQPAVFPLRGVIKGWQEGLKDAKVGSRVELVIPPALGYGDQESKTIPKNSTLVFVIDIIECFGSKQGKDGLAQLNKAKPTNANIAGIKIKGALGEEPKIEITDKAQFPKEKTVVSLSEGNGKVIKQGDTVIFHIMSKSSKEGFPERGTWKEGKDKYTAQIAPPELLGKKTGSRILLYFPSPDKEKPDGILVVDLLGVISSSEK